MSHTFSFTVEPFANPWLRCTDCGATVEGRVVAPGRLVDGENHPCRHTGMESICPSWGPVDGCRCEQFALTHIIPDPPPSPGPRLAPIARGRSANRACSGLAASWCAVHGSCTCPRPEDRQDDADCPLHSPTSTHAEPF